MKRGIMEMADLILVNKADGDLKAQATRTCADYAGALRLLRKRPQDPDAFPKAMTISALEASGLNKAWDEMQDLCDWRKDHAVWDQTRQAQATFWFGEDVKHGVLGLIADDPAISAQLQAAEIAVENGETAPALAAAKIVDALRDRLKK